MSRRVRRKLKLGHWVWIETERYLAGRGWVAAHCYVGEVTYLGRPHVESKWRSIEILLPNGTWHRTFTDHVKVVKICDEKEAQAWAGTHAHPGS